MFEFITDYCGRMYDLLSWYEIADERLSRSLFGERPPALTHEQWSAQRSGLARKQLLDWGLIEMTPTTPVGRQFQDAYAARAGEEWWEERQAKR